MQRYKRACTVHPCRPAPVEIRVSSQHTACSRVSSVRVRCGTATAMGFLADSKRKTRSEWAIRDRLARGARRPPSPIPVWLCASRGRLRVAGWGSDEQRPRGRNHRWSCSCWSKLRPSNGTARRGRQPIESDAPSSSCRGSRPSKSLRA